MSVFLISTPPRVQSYFDFSILIPIAAAIIGAFFGFLWQSSNEKKKEKRQVLSIIMMYRGLTAREDDFVKAINVIDIYFYDNKEVIKLLRNYLHHLTKPLFSTGEHSRILLDLILAMAKDIGYTDLKTTDIMDYYFPEKYGLSEPLTPEVPEN